MKRLFVLLFAALMFSVSSFAQRLPGYEGSADEMMPRMTIRALNSQEKTRLGAARALDISAACFTVVGAAACAGAVIYEVEYLEEKREDHFGASASDLAARNKFIAGAGAMIGSAVLCEAGAVYLRRTFRGKSVVRGTVGGFVIEF